MKIVKEGKYTTNDYPYGRLRCTRTSVIEWKEGKGYRGSHTTINPKTGRVNKPKKSTYYTYLYFSLNDETGHLETGSFDIIGLKDIKEFGEFLKQYGKDLKEFTTAQSQDLWAHIITVIKGGARYTSLKPDKDVVRDYLPLTKVKDMIKMEGDKKSILELGNIEIDLEAINELKVGQ